MAEPPEAPAILGGNSTAPPRCSGRRTCCARRAGSAACRTRSCRPCARSIRTATWCARCARRAAHDGAKAWACYHTDMDVTDHAGLPIGVVGLAVGAPFAVLVAEQLFASGCRLLISVTSAGQITPLGPTPYFVMIDRALRDEGTSQHYLPPSIFAEADAALADRAFAAVSTLPVPVIAAPCGRPMRRIARPRKQSPPLGTMARWRSRWRPRRFTRSLVPAAAPFLLRARDQPDGAHRRRLRKGRGGRDARFARSCCRGRPRLRIWMIASRNAISMSLRVGHRPEADPLWIKRHRSREGRRTSLPLSEGVGRRGTHVRSLWWRAPFPLTPSHKGEGVLLLPRTGAVASKAGRPPPGRWSTHNDARFDPGAHARRSIPARAVSAHSPRAPDRYRRIRVNSGSKNNWMLPVGPWRCLAMISPPCCAPVRTSAY